MSHVKSGNITAVASFFRAQCTDSELDLSSGEVISVAKYLGNLQFQVWKKMQSFVKYCEFILLFIFCKFIKSTFNI